MRKLGIGSAAWSVVGALMSSLLVGCNGGSSLVTESKRKSPAGTGLMLSSIKQGEKDRKFGVFLPHDYKKSNKSYPTIVFLHGLGEAGSNGTSNLGVGLAPAVEKRGKDFPFIVLFPQVSGRWVGDDKEKYVIDVLAKAKSDYRIDPDRVILTGLSTGGYGTWAIGADHSNEFAALVPMCAFGAEDRVSKLTKIPIWAFHNSGDPFVWSSDSSSMFKKIKAAGGNIKYTEYGAFGHDCWNAAYNDPELFKWMLAQRRVVR